MATSSRQLHYEGYVLFWFGSFGNDGSLRCVLYLSAITLILLAAVVAGASAAARCVRDNGSGQPGCKNLEEVTQGVWRHNHDPTAYWECSKLNQPATLNRCTSDSAFHPTLLECVSWDDWEWQPTCAPLTRPDVVDA